MEVCYTSVSAAPAISFKFEYLLIKLFVQNCRVRFKSNTLFEDTYLFEEYFNLIII